MNPKISHIFFGLYRVLIDPQRLAACYAESLGQVMATRFGLSAPDWTVAYQQIVADWDSYYADLDLNGDDGLDHMWEGLYRTTCALFRLTQTPEPPQPTLTALSRELPVEATRQCDSAYEDAKSIIQVLDAQGIKLGVLSHVWSGHAQAMLEGSGIRACFRGAIIGPDIVGHFDKDWHYLEVVTNQSGANPEQILILDADSGFCEIARKQGFRAVHIKDAGKIQQALSSLGLV